MRKIYKVLFPVIALLCLFAPHTARATHVMGSDIKWKCLGGDTFLITVTAYRDCNGIPLTGTNLGFESTDGSCTSGRVSANPTVCCGTDITPVCGRSCSRCISNSSCPFPLGIEQFTITVTVYMPPPCCNYKISWEECCRNGAITTGASGNDFWSEVELNRCVKPCDNSPYFTSPPVGIFCVNQCVVYNPGANDDDRDVNGNADSLAFSFGDPLSGPGSPIGYTSPYTNDAPLIYSGGKDDPFIPPNCYGFHIDPLTGDIMFKAKKTDQTVFVIVVDEYRRDSLGVERKIGTIRRDLQIAIIDCPANLPPIVTGINGGSTYSLKLCADQSTCFNIKAFDLDPPDSVTMSWNNQIPTATFTVKPDGKKWPTGVFCWRPKSSDVRSYPYQFVVTALDNHCPIPGRGVKAFSIYVIASPQANYTATVKNCGQVQFSATVAANSPTTITDFLWVGDGAPGYGPLYHHGPGPFTYKYTRAGTYHYQLSVTGPNKCVFTYVDSVKIPPFVFVSLPPDKTVCANAPPLTVTATFGLGNKPYNFSWNTGENGPTATSITKKISKDTAFVVTISDGNGCTNYDSMKVKIQKLPQPYLGPDQRGCAGHLLTLNTGLKGIASSTFWTKINGTDTFRNFIPPNNPIPVDSPGKYAVFVKDSFGCPGGDTVNIYFNPLVKARSGDTDVCINDSVPMDAGIAGPGSKYYWYDRRHPGAVISNSRHYTLPPVIYTPNGIPIEIVITQTTNGLMCSDTGYFQINVHKLPTPNIKALPDKCINDNAFSLTPYVDAQHQTNGFWYYPKNYSAVAGNYLYPKILGVTINDPSLGWIHYHYTDQFKCVSDDSVRIKISTLPQVYAGPDTEICTANGPYLLNQNGKFNPTGGQWVACPGTAKSYPTPAKAIVTSAFGDSIFFDPSKVPVDTVYGVIYQYKHTSGTSAICDNSDTVYISVKTNPKLKLDAVPTQCSSMDPVQLNATPGGGVWSLADGTNPAALTYDAQTNSYIFNPAKSDSGNHKLVYEAWADLKRHLCSTTDTMSIYVVPAPVIYFETEDKAYDYCESHVPVLLRAIPNWPGGQFSGRGVYSTGGSTFYFDPSGKNSTGADTSGDSMKNVITYSVPYNNGACNVTTSRHIAVDPHPSVFINTSTSQCSGSNQIDLTADVHNIPDATFLSWTSPDGNNTPFTNIKLVGNTATATYHPTLHQLNQLKYVIRLVGRNKGACDSSVSVDTIHIYPRPVPDFATPKNIGCDPLTVDFTSSFTIPGIGTIGTYDWNFGDGSPDAVGKIPAIAHTYHVTNGQSQQQFTVKLIMATNIHGCTGEKDSVNYITVFATPKPVIDANPLITTIAVPKIQFDVDEHLSRGINFGDPKTTYKWTFGDDSAGKPTFSTIKNPSHTYGDTGNYKVFLNVKSNECIGVDSTIIHVQPELIIYIPNVFTPGGKHGDGKPHGDNHYGLIENNTFQPVITGYASFDMSIYNRWGELMYETNSPDPSKGWDGTYQGQPPVMDAYVYVIKATSFSGKPYTFTGSVTILR